MKLQEFLNKFTNHDFLVTVDGLWDEMPFWEYEDEKKCKYWQEYKNREIKSFAILTTNEQPELCIRLKERR